MPHTRSFRVVWRGSQHRALAVICALGAVALLAPAAAVGGDYVRATGPSDVGGPSVYTTTNGQKLFYAHRRKLVFSYRVEHPKPVDVTARLIAVGTGETLKRWYQTVDDARERYVEWNGVIGDRLQRERKYAFRLTARDSSGATTQSAREGDTSRDSFRLWHNRFPVRGKHTWGDGMGAGRGHQGQDIFADCGTPLEAARGGRVQYAGYQSSAGKYVVIDGSKTGRDYVYMHLKRMSVQTGQRVRTGERIGTVGDTGNATGCHLHFELWSKPGWYEGGSAIDPTPHLKRWDEYS